jgi:hypothetical protein
MRNISLFLLLLILNGTLKGQSPYHLIERELISIDSFIVVQIENSGFYSYCDSNFDIRYLKFLSDISSKEKHELIDSVGCTPYSSLLYIYKSKKYKDYLIFWITDNEYTSDILLYILKNDELTKLGPLKIQNDCETCEDLIYPGDWFKITGHNDQIIIRPAKAFKYDIGNDNWQKFKPNEAIIKVDKRNTTLTLTQTML